MNTRNEALAKKLDYCRLAQLLIIGHKASNSSIVFCTSCFHFRLFSSSLVVVHCCNNAKGDKCWGRNNVAAVVFSLQYKEFFSPVSLQWQSAFILTPKVRKTSWWIDPFHSFSLEPCCWVKNWLIMQIQSSLRCTTFAKLFMASLHLDQKFPLRLAAFAAKLSIWHKKCLFCFKSREEK